MQGTNTERITANKCLAQIKKLNKENQNQEGKKRFAYARFGKLYYLYTKELNVLNLQNQEY